MHLVNQLLDQSLCFYLIFWVLLVHDGLVVIKILWAIVGGDVGVGVGALHRDVEHLTGEDVAGAVETAYHIEMMSLFPSTTFTRKVTLFNRS